MNTLLKFAYVIFHPLACICSPTSQGMPSPEFIHEDPNKFMLHVCVNLYTYTWTFEHLILLLVVIVVVFVVVVVVIFGCCYCHFVIFCLFLFYDHIVTLTFLPCVLNDKPANQPNYLNAPELLNTHVFLLLIIQITITISKALSLLEIQEKQS